MEVRPSVRAPAQDGPTGTQKKNFWIFWTAASLNASHRKPLWCLKTPLSGFFMPTASVLAMPRFRKAACGAKLRRLDGMILREAESKLRANQERNVKNSTAYTMAVLFNCIAESESDLMIDPYLNAICAVV